MKKLLVLLLLVSSAFVDGQTTGWWNESVFYEIFVRSFQDSDGDGIGDFNGITQRLDYLNDGDPNTNSDLGINAIWLMPINPSPSYHGYDVTDYYGINPDYGTMADFQNFLTEAHNRGIKVIIDLVLNHSSTQHPWFQAARTGNPTYRDFYRWSPTNPGYSGPWGQTVWHQNSFDSQYYYGIFWGQMPDLNFNHQPVKDSIAAIVDYWLTDIGVDGFRCDAVKYLYENGSALEDQPQTLAYWQEFRALIDSINPNAMAVGEAWTNTASVVPYATNDRFNFCFEFDLAYDLLNGINNGSPLSITSQMNTVYTSYDSLQYAPFLSNHDQNRVFTEFQSDEIKMKAAAGLYLTLPGVPFIYYGEEVGMVGQGDHLNIRRPMQWDTSPYAGFTTGTGWQGVPLSYLNYNVSTLENDPQSIWNHYRKLVHLRQNSQALKWGSYTVRFTSRPNEVLAYERHLQSSVGTGPAPYLVVSNVSDQPITNCTVTLRNELAWDPNLFFSDVLYSETFTASKSLTSPDLLIVDSIPAKTTLVFEVNVSFSVAEQVRSLWVPFPNPAAKQLRIRYDQSAPEQAILRDALGRVVLEQSISSNEILLPGLPAGWYTLQLSNTHHSEVHKILIQH